MSKKLAMNTTVEGETYKAGTVPSAEVAKKITNPKAWGGDAPEVGAENETGKGYKDMKPEELEAEVEKRNADREDDARIEVTGTGANGNVKKGDLVAALEADDAAASE